MNKVQANKLKIKCSCPCDVSKQTIDLISKVCYIIYIIEVKLHRSIMSLITSVSIREENKSKYFAMRNWLSMKNMSMGDYLIENWDNQFERTQQKVLTNNLRG